MSSQSTDASSDDVSVAGTEMVMLEIKFQFGSQFHPWRDRVRAREWLQEILNESDATKEAVVWKVLYHSASYGRTVYLEDLPRHAADDVVAPYIRPLLGQMGKIRRLNNEEVAAALARDQAHKSMMHAREASIGGDLNRVSTLLEKALGWQGQIDEASPSQKHKRMAAQALEVYWTAQQVAKNDVRTKDMRREESEE